MFTTTFDRVTLGKSNETHCASHPRIISLRKIKDGLSHCVTLSPTFFLSGTCEPADWYQPTCIILSFP